MAYGPSWTRESLRVHASKRVKHDLTHEGAKVYSSCLFAERFRLHFESDTLTEPEVTAIELVKLLTIGCGRVHHSFIVQFSTESRCCREHVIRGFFCLKFLRYFDEKEDELIRPCTQLSITWTPTVLLKNLLLAILFFYLICTRLYFIIRRIYSSIGI